MYAVKFDTDDLYGWELEDLISGDGDTSHRFEPGDIEAQKNRKMVQETNRAMVMVIAPDDRFMFREGPR